MKAVFVQPVTKILMGLVVLTLMVAAVSFATLSAHSAHAAQHPLSSKCANNTQMGSANIIAKDNSVLGTSYAYYDTCTTEYFTEVQNSSPSNPYTAACISNGSDPIQCNSSTSITTVDSPELPYHQGSMASCGDIGVSAQNNRSGCVIY